MILKQFAILPAALALGAFPAFAQTSGAPAEPAGPPFSASYADAADLLDAAPLVLRVQPRKIARVDDARAAGVGSGSGRFYIEAATVALVFGHADLAPAVSFLVDMPLDSKGKPPALKKRDVLLFARPVAGNPGQLALVAPDAMLLWTPESDARVRAILTAMLKPDAPAKITGVREIVFVPGDLAGEGETQVFLRTANGSAASLTVQHRSGAPVRWGASFSELTADIDAPPQRDTLEWYRLACFLPRTIAAEANLSDGPTSQAQALADYRTVLDGLGDCSHLRHPAAGR
jgi:hypothetical protein